MNKLPIEAGSIVISKAGRDMGRRLLVVQEINEDFVLVADGRLRTMDRLKTKRRKHLSPTGQVVEDARDRLNKGKSVFDHEVRAWLSEEEG